MKKLISVLLVLSIGCSHTPAKNPMTAYPISVSNQFVLGIINRGSTLDRTALEACVSEYPKLTVVDETQVHRSLRDAALSVEDLLAANRFEMYQNLQGFHMLMIAYRAGGQDYLKFINFLGRYTTTVLMDVQKPTCKQVFQSQRIIVVDSNPPYADVFMGDRKLGETPVWTWFRDGQYSLNCSLPGQKFRPVTFQVPKDAFVVCQREEISSKDDMKEAEPLTAEEKAGSALIYIIGAAVALAGLVLPYLLFK